MPTAALWSGWAQRFRNLPGPFQGFSAASLPGVPLLPDVLGPNARLAVEVAWGADVAAAPELWTWTEITTDVREDPGITVTTGRSDEASSAQPAQCSMVLDNAQARYSLGGESPNWPNVRRNVPVRVRVDPDGTGFAVVFQGFADGFTPSWDSPKGTIPTVTLSASGTLRRLSQGASPLLSPLRRAMVSTATVKAYWPMEDGPDSTALAAAVGGLTGVISGTPDLASDDETFVCSTALPKSNASRFDFPVPPYVATGKSQVRWLMFVPAAGITDGLILARVWTSGSLARWDVEYDIGGDGALRVQVYNDDGSFHSEIGFANYAVDGFARRISLELTQTGADIFWRVNTTAVGDTGASGGTNGTIAGETFGTVTKVEITPNLDVNGVTFGHLTVQDDVTILWEAFGPLKAHTGEFGATLDGRLERLCAENRVKLDRLDGVGGTTYVDQMGIQSVATLLSVLRDVEAVDQGLLFDGRSAGLSYRSRRYVEDQTTATLVVDAAAGDLAAPFAPVDDDQRTRNKVTVERRDGIQATYEDVTGPLGTAVVGTYDESTAINAFSDLTPYLHAGWRVHRGTVEGYRYPSLTLNFRAAPHLARDFLGVGPGDRVDIEGLDTALDGIAAGIVSLVVEGVTQEISGHSWTATLKCSSFDAWRVAVLAADTGDTGPNLLHLDTDGSVLAAGVGSGATSLSVVTPSGPLWTTAADDCPFDVEVGGIRVTVTAVTGASSPQTFTVTGVAKALPEATPVKVWRPTVLGL